MIHINIYIYVIHDSLNTKNIAGLLGIVHGLRMFFFVKSQVVDPPRAGLDPVTLEAVSGTLGARPTREKHGLPSGKP